MLNDKKALVCGAGGFIGSHLVKKLKSEGFWVRGVDLKYPEFCDTKADDFIIADLRDQNVYNNIYEKNIFDEVYQLAADMGGAGFIFTGENDAQIMHNDAMINLNTLEACRKYKVKKVFYSSSACIYPEYNQLDPDNPKCFEESAYPAAPDSEYGWEKLFSERLFLAYNRNYGLDVRIARFHNIFGPCYDKETEILTTKGWKYFCDLDRSEKVATLCPDTNKLVWQKPVAYQKYKYNGDMYKIKGRRIDQMITEDHKIYYSTLTTIKGGKIKKNKFGLKKVSDSKWDRSRMFFTSNFEWDGIDIKDEYVFHPIEMSDGKKLYCEKKIKMKDWFEFIGWFVTEGSMFKTPSNYTICISQYQEKNVVNRKKIEELLKRMKIKFSGNDKNIIILNKQLYKVLEKEAISKGANNKNIPIWMISSQKKYLKILYDALMWGDGNKTGKRFNTTSKILKDQFMEIALKLGKSVNCTLENDDNNNHSIIYRISISDSKYFCSKRDSRSVVHYNDFVYDVTVPNYHIILTRRNGKVCWSGNCGTWEGGREKAPAAMCRKIAMAKNEDIIEIWGDGKQTRSFLYIEECLSGIRKLMDSDFIGPVNIGSEEMVTINQLVSYISNISDKKISIKHIDGPLGVRGRNSDNKLIEEKLGWKPSTLLKNGLKITYEWIECQVNKKNK